MSSTRGSVVTIFIGFLIVFVVAFLVGLYIGKQLGGGEEHVAQVEQRSADEGLAGISQEEKPAQGEKVTAAGAEVEASKAGAGTKPFGADIFEDEKPRSSEAAVTPKAVKEPAPEKVKKVEPVVAGVGKPEKAEGKPKSPKL